MKVLVVLGHQNPGSFNHAIFQTVVDELQAMGHSVTSHDLYAEGFDPILPHGEIPKTASPSPDVARHCDDVAQADGFVMIHPNWWASVPAILKGWLDRVFRQGLTFDFGPEGLIGLLEGRRALVLTTSNTPRDVEVNVYGDPLENYWKTCVFGFCGVKHFKRRNFESIVMSSPEQRAGWLDEVRGLVRERFSGVDD